MRGESMFRQHTLRHVARKIRHEMIETINRDLGGQLSVERTNELEGLRKRLSALEKAVDGYVICSGETTSAAMLVTEQRGTFPRKL